jgi:hypothetical protein
MKDPTHPTARDPFLWELALRLGTTVAALAHTLSYTEYLDWQGYKAARLQYLEALGKQKKKVDATYLW